MKSALKNGLKLSGFDTNSFIRVVMIGIIKLKNYIYNRNKTIIRQSNHKKCCQASILTIKTNTVFDHG